MGFLHIKDPPSPDKHKSKLTMAPPSDAPPGPGAVDRLATFFLSKFQETKKESELTTLQCTTQLKFEAAEKALEEHTRTIATLRSEIQSFWDKAPSFFLHKFSAQLDALAAGRSEKTGIAMSRLERRVDDEVKNLDDQLSELSTKLAVSNAALNASVDDVGKKIGAGNDAVTENLRRCESDFRSKVARLESLLESSKTDAAIERDKINRTFQEASRRLQSKLDSLELTVMRQSEELTGQCEKIERLENEVQKLSQLTISHDKAHGSVLRMLSTHSEELAKLATAQTTLSGASLPVKHSMRHPSPSTTTGVNFGPVSSTPQVPHIVRHQPPEALDSFPVQGYRGHPPTVQDGYLRTTGHAKRSYNDRDQTSSSEQGVTTRSFPEHAPKRQKRGKGARSTHDKKDTASQANRKKPVAQPEETQPSPIMAKPKPRTRPGKTEDSKAQASETEQTPTMSHNPLPQQPRRSKKGGAQKRPQNEPQRESDIPSTPERAVEPRDKNKPVSSPARRDATMAFIAHVKECARQFVTSPPRSERQFIWMFLEGIPDPAWAEYIQKKMLEEYPSMCQPSRRLRSKHLIDFDSELTWRHVVDLIRGMQHKPGSAPQQ